MPTEESEVATRRIGAWLLGVAVALLPTWDALEEVWVSLTLTSCSPNESSEVFIPLGVFGYPCLGLACAFVLGRASRGVVRVTIVMTFAYALLSPWWIARERSARVDHWALCEASTRTPAGEPATGWLVFETFGGPRLASGNPCVRVRERRDLHHARNPHGSFADGVTQICMRFPRDRTRLFLGTSLTLALLAVGAFLVRPSRDRRARTR